MVGHQNNFLLQIKNWYLWTYGTHLVRTRFTFAVVTEGFYKIFFSYLQCFARNTRKCLSKCPFYAHDFFWTSSHRSSLWRSQIYVYIFLNNIFKLLIFSVRKRNLTVFFFLFFFELAKKSTFIYVHTNGGFEIKTLFLLFQETPPRALHKLYSSAFDVFFYPFPAPLAVESDFPFTPKRRAYVANLNPFRLRWASPVQVLNDLCAWRLKGGTSVRILLINMRQACFHFLHKKCVRFLVFCTRLWAFFFFKLIKFTNVKKC